MGKVKNAVLLICVMSLVSGCMLLRFHKYGTGGYETYDRAYNIEIDSDSPGVTIKINGNYIGTTPLLYTHYTQLDPKLYEHDIRLYNTDYLKVEALPKEEGQLPQIRVISINPNRQDEIPKKIFFKMQEQPK